MRFDFKEYILDSEGNDYYTLYKKGIYKENPKGKTVKPENIGKESLTIIGYFNSINSGLNKIGNIVVAENSDIETVIDKLNDLRSEIAQVSKKLSLGIEVIV